MPRYDDQVFLNVPFDARYAKLLQALVFAVHECGLVARCALEEDDGGQVRVAKLYQIIWDCRLGIHDLSRTTLDAQNGLPRFNMPFELGVYRYQIFCSDISRQDIRAHHNEVSQALTAVRNWLQANLPAARRLPGPSTLIARYVEFRRQLPFMCRVESLRPSELTFLDYRRLVGAWIVVNSLDASR